MKTTTPFLKSFGSFLYGRKPAKKVLEKDDLGELYEVFQTLVPQSIFERPPRGANSRQRDSGAYLPTLEKKQRCPKVEC